MNINLAEEEVKEKGGVLRAQRFLFDAFLRRKIRRGRSTECSSFYHRYLFIRFGFFQVRSELRETATANSFIENYLCFNDYC